MWNKGPSLTGMTQPFHKAIILSATTISRDFTQPKIKKNQVSSSSVLMKELRGERSDWLEPTERLRWLTPPLFTIFGEQNSK